jgi:cystathionine gamma-synthase
MGGSLVLNQRGRHFQSLKLIQEAEYEDNFFNQNAIFLERNSRDFLQRVKKIDENALSLIDMLCKAKEGKFSNVIKDIYYPSLVSTANYNQCKREGGGYGGLLSITFHDIRISATFFDALPCAKGPSLGTNFTLVSPFVILAHYGELDWAASFGVEANLIRVSVGLEDSSSLLGMFSIALEAAQEALK